MNLAPSIWLFLLLSLNSSICLSQQTQTFRGRLIHINGVDSLVKSVQVRLLDLGAGTSGTDGIFSVAIPTDVNEVTVELVDGNSTIIYPRGGKTSVPRDPNTISEFIVGEPTMSILTRAIAKSNNEIKSNLEQIGISQGAIEETLVAFRNDIQALTDIKISDLKKEIELEDRQSLFYQEMSTTLLNYINEAKDIKDAFKFVSRHAFEDQQALILLSDAVNNYNSAFEEMNKKHSTYELEIQNLWQSESRTSEAREVFNYALGELHSSNIFVLNLALEDINRYFRGDIRTSEKRKIKEDILKEIDRTELQLDRRLAELDKRAQIFLANLKN
jgi:uncharacterized protein YueI